MIKVVGIDRRTDIQKDCNVASQETYESKSDILSYKQSIKHKHPVHLANIVTRQMTKMSKNEGDFPYDKYNSLPLYSVLTYLRRTQPPV
jgi:hypothetical protein